MIKNLNHAKQVVARRQASKVLASQPLVVARATAFTQQHIQRKLGMQ